jgi:hypothetical protein
MHLILIMIKKMIKKILINLNKGVIVKLIKEYITPDQFEFLKESEEIDGKLNKVYKIKGVFLQSEIKNRNGRIYSRGILEREVSKYYNEKIRPGRALGELDHPTTPSVNLARVSHIIESLVQSGNDWIGVARIMDTPNGRIAKTLIDEGIKLGTSSRGIGTIKNGIVGHDFSLLVAGDIVCDPSAPAAFVEGILENKEYIINGDDIVEVAISSLQHKVNNKYDSKVLTGYLVDFINNINKNV